MMKFSVLLIIFIISFSTVYGQTQGNIEIFQYKAPQFLYEEKCSKCHTLERVFTEHKTENEWRICIAKMIQKNPLWITETEEVQITDEILGRRNDIVIPYPQKKKYADTQLLFIDRCTKCHTASRILKENKTEEEWKETIIKNAR